VIIDGADTEVLSPLVAAIRQEAQKHGIATSSAFVLVEWCSLLMQHLAGTPSWEKLGTDIILASADALEKCVQASSRESVAHSALVIMRRGVRKLVSKQETREKVISSGVTALSAKSSQPTSKNAIMLGVFAGVCSRKPEARPILEKMKKDYLTFYTREIIGSKTPLPKHLADGLADFFSAFVTPDDMDKEIFPAIEKGLLRAPEVVLNDLLTPLVHSLPEDYDLSTALSGRLLKPLLSNIKSSNATIRAGAVTAFKEIVTGCRDFSVLEQVADEILNPLKTGKLPSADHKVLHSEMLLALPMSSGIASKLSAALPAVAGKEGNEAALSAETLALNSGAIDLLSSDAEVPKALLDVYAKGLAEKKLPFRRIWILRAGEVLYTFNIDGQLSGNVVKFAEAVFPPLIDTFNEVVANPLAASQNGLVIGALVMCSVASLLQRSESSKLSALAKKSPVQKHALTLEPKPSFLLNPRIYTKLTSDDDNRWLFRSLGAVAPAVSSAEAQGVGSAWAQAFIYLLCSSTVSTAIHREASDTLSDLYVRSKGIASDLIITGLWDWIQALETGDKESAAILAKAELSSLKQVLKAICLTPKDYSTRAQADPPKDQLEKQMCSLLVLAQQELMPGARWINICLKVEVDPGELARKHEKTLLDEVIHRTAFEQVRLPSSHYYGFD
jgi:hypothetical protein